MNFNACSGQLWVNSSKRIREGKLLASSASRSQISIFWTMCPCLVQSSRDATTRLRDRSNNDSPDEFPSSPKRNLSDVRSKGLLPVPWCRRSCHAAELHTESLGTLPCGHYAGHQREHQSCWGHRRFQRWVYSTVAKSYSVWHHRDIFRQKQLRSRCTILGYDDIEFMIVSDNLSSDTPTRTSFTVSLACRDSLARTSGTPACSTVDVNQDLPVCELRTPSDMKYMASVVKIAGAIWVIISNTYIRLIWCRYFRSATSSPTG